MPTYEYLCEKCQHNFEISQKMSEDSLKKCPTCGEDSLRRVINATAFHLKGSGWYKTDYASSSTSGGAASTNTSSATDSNGSNGKSDVSTSDKLTTSTTSESKAKETSTAAPSSPSPSTTETSSK